MKLHGEVVEISNISQPDIRRMFNLMDLHYENMSWDMFTSDLSEKSWAVIIKDEKNIIQGFTTMLFVAFKFGGKDVKGIFSGDTIINKEYWGSLELPRVWGRFVLELAAEYKNGLFYWFLISKGYKTYKYLSTFYKSYYPRLDTPTPEFEKSLMDHFGSTTFSGQYDSHAGVIRANHKKDFLKLGVADITARQLKDPNIEFFAKANPGYAIGDELVCIASLSPDNIKSFFHSHLMGKSHE
ncbi:hypothetical protein SAMN02745945_00126 [Peptoclostridium litorale DSM 5388]|uniref:N-acetyltransferase domain-containing protein n=1 Tax=Peptoclostridium litorale DSM 5388 TaxID=1121324 RepID=A0A069RHZ3_PEPLI|nr:hypothetical protein [Peptoclostridium litorale]KDR96624.1 hypothetical protein CLIT_2c02300 [Peptoclostridium litorale DSM 5388]SIN68338.1 hypothetical protein SAMN02745945_00126 [Peptoclostridium litorale DSM 5388]